MSNHDTSIVSEEPTEVNGRIFTARRNAEPESDGSWRWAVFVKVGSAPAGFLQSHYCPDYSGALRLLVFGLGCAPIGKNGTAHPCVAHYPYALRLLAEYLDGSPI